MVSLRRRCRPQTGWSSRFNPFRRGAAATPEKRDVVVLLTFLTLTIIKLLSWLSPIPHHCVAHELSAEI
jgi:hypothetical protein